MKLSKMIKTLKAAKKAYGDVNVKLMQPNDGHWIEVAMLIKLHPYTEQHGCLNRQDPVDAIGITDWAYDTDLKIS
jgi:hypothetical protein